MSPMPRLAVVTSHPIQYHSPLFRALAQRVDLDVYYGHQQDAAGQAAAGFGVAFEWDVPLLGGYRHHFLRNVSATPGVSAFGECDTPDVGRVLAEGQYDACFITGWYLKSYLQALLACRRLGIPALSRGDSQLATRGASIVSLAKYLPYRALLAQFAGHLYVGQANRAYLRHFGVPDSKLFFTPHFVDNAFFAGRADEARTSGARADIRRHAGADEQGRVMLFVGKLIDKKRPLDFVDAVARASAGDARIRGLIVGSGPLQQAVDDRIRALGAPVTCAGFRNQTELPSYFAAADALVLPSDAGETWGLVVNEAMACGVPALVSRACGCVHDLITDGSTGYGFPLGDVDALAQAMRRVADRLTHEPRVFRDAVLSRISGYSCERAADGVVQALDRVAASPRVRSTTGS